MALSFPDVLVSSVLEVIRGARGAVVTAEQAARVAWWRRVLRRRDAATPAVRTSCDRWTALSPTSRS